MADFNRAMSQMLAVFANDLGGKVTVQEIEAMPRLGFLAIPGTEYSDRIFQEFFPRRETQAVMKATQFLRKVAQKRKNPASAPSTKFSLSDFTSSMSELLKVFTEECGGHVTMAELGSRNPRLSMFTKKGVEQSDLLYKEFYPKRETAELKKAIAILKGIAEKRKNGGGDMLGKGSMGIDISGGVKIIPKRREPKTVYNPVTQVTPIKQPANDFSNFYSPAAPLVKNAVLNAMNSDAKPAAAPANRDSFMVFDYESFSMKPVQSFI